MERTLSEENWFKTLKENKNDESFEMLTKVYKLKDLTQTIIPAERYSWNF